MLVLEFDKGGPDVDMEPSCSTKLSSGGSDGGLEVRQDIEQSERTELVPSKESSVVSGTIVLTIDARIWPYSSVQHLSELLHRVQVVLYMTG
jgi:hypothetical protein